MARKSRKHRGGASYSLSGAPIDYNMRPGAFVETLGRFPVDQTASPQILSDLDVFFQSGMSQNCGIENSTLVVPINMGTNLVGGGRKKTKKTRKSRGGALEFHPYLASAVPNIVQSLSNDWNGGLESIPPPADPTIPMWEMETNSGPVMEVMSATKPSQIVIPSISTPVISVPGASGPTVAPSSSIFTLPPTTRPPIVAASPPTVVASPPTVAAPPPTTVRPPTVAAPPPTVRPPTVAAPPPPVAANAYGPCSSLFTLPPSTVKPPSGGSRKRKTHRKKKSNRKTTRSRLR